MGLTQITSDGITDATIATADLADQSVTLAKLPHGTSSNDGKFLRANNGADPTFETVNTDLVSDTSPQLGGDLHSNGNNIVLGDSSGSSDDRIQLGASQDLQLYHNGTDSAIYDSGTGRLKIYSNGAGIDLRKDDGEAMVLANTDGAVELYHNNSKRFETNSAGVHVFGNMFIEDGSSSTNKITLGTGGDLNIYHDGSHSYIKDSGTGKLRLLSNSFRVLNAGNSENMIAADENGAVELYYDGSKKLETRSDGVSVFNELSVGTSDIQSASVASFVGGQYNQVNIADGSNSGWGLLLAQQQGTNNSSQYTYSTNSSTNKPCSVVNVQNDALHFATNNTARFRIEHDGHVIPSANNSYDLGSSGYKWRNIYTNDLNLSNEGSTNDVDGTWGSYTIQEGAEDLFLVNKRNGKKYKFNLTEVS